MPRRTNFFQELIALLETQLAPLNAKVTSSRLLKDYKTGEEREVDVVIEATVGSHPLTIGIEVNDRKRPASTTWIEAVAKKHEDLAIHKTIVVSRAGFYRPALAKAKLLNIDTLTIEQVRNSDWKAKIDGLTTVSLDSFLLPHLTEANVLLSQQSSIADIDFADIGAIVVYDATGRTRGTLHEELQKTLSDDKFISAVKQRAFTDGGTIVSGKLAFAPGCYVRGRSGKEHAIVGVEFKARCARQVASVDALKGRYRDAALAFVEGKSFGHRVRVLLTEKAGDQDIAASVDITTREENKRGA